MASGRAPAERDTRGRVALVVRRSLLGVLMDGEEAHCCGSGRGRWNALVRSELRRYCAHPQALAPARPPAHVSWGSPQSR